MSVMTSAAAPSTGRGTPGGGAPWGLPRGLIVVLATAGLLGAILGLQQFRSILAPVLLALVLVVGVHPVTGMLRRRGVPPWLAVTTTLLTVCGIVLGLAGALAVSIGHLATLLPEYQDQFTQLVGDLQHALQAIGVGPEQIQTALSGVSFGKVAGVLAGALAAFAGMLSNLVFILFVAAFMVLDSPHFARRFDHIAAERESLVVSLGNFTRGTRSYLLVSTVFGLIVAVIDTGFLWLAGVPLPLLWGLLAFITNYIPNIGFLIGVFPPALLALLEGGPQLMLIVIVGYSVINFVIQSIIQPKYVSDAVSLSLTLTFLSLIFWTFVIGPLGAVLAIPLTLLGKALLIDIDPNTRWMSALISSGPGPDDGVDTEDAGTVVTDEPVVTATTGEATTREAPTDKATTDETPARVDAG
jgi:predicted PurR-regulated permease PerM